MSLMYKIRDRKIIGAAVIDRASYYIYLFHVLFIFWLDKVIMPVITESIGSSSTTAVFALRALMTYVMCIALALLYAFIRYITAKVKDMRHGGGTG